MFSSHQILTLIHQWDVTTFTRVRHIRAMTALPSLAKLISRSADGWLYPLVAMMLWVIDYPAAIDLFNALLIAFTLERAIYLLVKKGFRRKRPAHVLPNFNSDIIASDEFSFPSGHTSGAFVFVTLLTLLVNPLFACLYLWSIAVGCSRVILGVHFPTDTFVGALLGVSCAHFAVITGSYVLADLVLGGIG